MRQGRAHWGPDPERHMQNLKWDRALRPRKCSHNKAVSDDTFLNLFLYGVYFFAFYVQGSPQLSPHGRQSAAIMTFGTRLWAVRPGQTQAQRSDMLLRPRQSLVNSSLICSRLLHFDGRARLSNEWAPSGGIAVGEKEGTVPVRIL